jgi:hypothetical protein
LYGIKIIKIIPFLFVFFSISSSAQDVIPFVKKIEINEPKLSLKSVYLAPTDSALENEKKHLLEKFAAKEININSDGIPLSLSIGTVPIPELNSTYQKDIETQAYQISVDESGIKIKGINGRAIYYGILTLDFLLNSSHEISHMEIIDWPDLPVRMIMLDPARQNENFDYYKRVIKFASRYKLNSILIHLTDDQTSALFHEDFEELMHPNAWKKSEIENLIAFAKRYHVDLIPEIESLGHSRMFTRLPDFQEYLHQTGIDTVREGWSGTGIPGYTNVLCPASPKAIDYLNKMYLKTAESFDHSWIHIGLDEVDITNCERCFNTFGEISVEDWFALHLNKCKDQLTSIGKKAGVWGDMLIHYPKILDKLSPEQTIIFDWNYRSDVDDKSVKLFKEKGFEIIASAALVCWPHMILPDEHNFENIRKFTEIARENDLLGINTTIWIPTRYMSDVLWDGIAFAAVHAWSGSVWDEEQFYEIFSLEFFGSGGGKQFGKMRKELRNIIWHLDDFNTSCWIDQKSLDKAQNLYTEKETEVNDYILKLTELESEMKNFSSGVYRNITDWEVLIQSTEILKYVLVHLQSAPAIIRDLQANKIILENLDKICVKFIKWIEDDWNRNRYEDDPNKEGIYLPNQHLLYRFKQMHLFHQQLLSE